MRNEKISKFILLQSRIFFKPSIEGKNFLAFNLTLAKFEEDSFQNFDARFARLQFKICL